MSGTELSMNIYGLKLLQILAKSSPYEWKSVFELTLKAESTQDIMGLVLFLKDPALVEAALWILRSTDCPLEITANAISSIETPGHRLSEYQYSTKNHQNRVFVTQKVNHLMHERIGKCIDKILGARSSDEVFLVNI